MRLPMWLMPVKKTSLIIALSPDGRRLDQALRDYSMQFKNARLPSPRVCGPSCYPDDGLFGRLLIDTALSIDHDGEES